MKIIDRTKEYYPDLKGAEYLELEDERIPEGWSISKCNVHVPINCSKKRILGMGWPSRI